MGNIKCWRKGGCLFNSSNSPKYLKCNQDYYSLEQCKQDNEYPVETYYVIAFHNMTFYAGTRYSANSLKKAKKYDTYEQAQEAINKEVMDMFVISEVNIYPISIQISM